MTPVRATNAPIHLFDKGVFKDPAPGVDWAHAPHATVLLDSGRAALLQQRGWALVDQWSVYVTPDRRALVYVNADGSLRRARPYHPICEENGLK
jgi:hypothetical protein